MNVMKTAKKLRKQFPRMKWKDLVKKAGRKVKNRNRQTGRSDKKADETRKAKRPGKRRSRSGRQYTERRKNRSDVPGSLTGMKATAKKNLASGLVDRDLATTIKATKVAQKKITKWRRVFKSLSL